MAERSDKKDKNQAPEKQGSQEKKAASEADPKTSPQLPGLVSAAPVTPGRREDRHGDV